MATAFRAVLFDLDGTMYWQPPLRALMAAQLGIVPWTRHAPAGVARLWRVLRVFRSARERLRALGEATEPLERMQYRAAAEQAGVAIDEVEAAVEEWIFRRPLALLPLVRRARLADTFQQLHNAGLHLGVFSDYPTAPKLDSLGVRRFFSIELCATDADVNAFKPHPRGFLRACEQWNLSPDQVLYVGDRRETDALGAAAAGLDCVLMGHDVRHFHQVAEHVMERACR